MKDIQTKVNLCFFKNGTSNQHPTPSVFDLSFHVNGLSFSLGSSAAADAAAIGLGIPSLMCGTNKKKSQVSGDIQSFDPTYLLFVFPWPDFQLKTWRISSDLPLYPPKK